MNQEEKNKIIQDEKDAQKAFLAKEAEEETKRKNNLLAPGLIGIPASQPGVSTTEQPTRGTIKDTNLTNQDGQPLEINRDDTLLIVGKDVPEDEAAKEARLLKEENTKKFQTMLKEANDSLKGKKIGEVGLDHIYWGLMNSARKFQVANDL